MDEQRIKIIRRTGLLTLGVLMLLFSVPMLIGAFRGVQSNQIWDPYTGHMLSESKSEESSCRSQAEVLIKAAGKMTSREPAWEEKVRLWTVRCRKEHPEPYQMLMSTRRNIGGKVSEPAPE